MHKLLHSEIIIINPCIVTVTKTMTEYYTKICYKDNSYQSGTINM